VSDLIAQFKAQFVGTVYQTLVHVEEAVVIGLVCSSA